MRTGTFETVPHEKERIDYKSQNSHRFINILKYKNYTAKSFKKKFECFLIYLV